MGTKGSTGGNSHKNTCRYQEPSSYRPLTDWGVRNLDHRDTKNTENETTESECPMAGIRSQKSRGRREPRGAQTPSSSAGPRLSQPRTPTKRKCSLLIAKEPLISIRSWCINDSLATAPKQDGARPVDEIECSKMAVASPSPPREKEGVRGKSLLPKGEGWGEGEVVTNSIETQNGQRFVRRVFPPLERIIQPRISRIGTDAERSYPC